MDIKYMSVEDLIPYENNPRKNEEAVDLVAASIREFGFKVPIVIDKEKVVVAGHTRLKAAEALGLAEVPVVVADDLTDDQIRAFRLADNKVSEAASWDFFRLDQELETIQNIHMADFGFLEIGDLSDDLFSDKEEKPKTYTCPCCGRVFALDSSGEAVEYVED